MKNCGDVRQRDCALLKRVLAREPGADLLFVERFTPTIEISVRRVLRKTGLAMSADDVADMVNEVWLTLLDRDLHCLRCFEEERKIAVTTWISLVARNKTIDRLRLAYQRLVKLRDDQQLAEHPSPAPSPQNHMEACERLELAQRALAELKQDDLDFLEALYIDDRRPEELAVEYGIAVATVYTRRFKIQQKLARHVRGLCAEERRRLRFGFAAA